MNEENGKNGNWRVLGAVAITLVISMSTNYFVFFREMVDKDSFLRLENEVRLIKSIQDQRGTAVGSISALRQEINLLSKEIFKIPHMQTQLDGLQRNIQDLRYTVTGHSGNHPPKPRDLE